MVKKRAGFLGLDENTRKKYLDYGIPVGRPLAFVIQFAPQKDKKFTKDDYLNVFEYKNSLVETNNCYVQVHRESERIHLTGLVLNKPGYTRFEDLYKKLKSENTDAKIALSLPEEGDLQYVTQVDQYSSTIYGSSILALARGEKVEINSLATVSDIPVYQLDSSNNLTDQESEKGTPVKKISFDPTQYNWEDSMGNIDKINQLTFTKKVDTQNLSTKEIFLKDYIVVKIDINESGKMIAQFDIAKGKQNIENRFLVIAANIELLCLLKNYIQHDPQSYSTNLLGDSVFLFIRKKGKMWGVADTLETFRKLMNAFVEAQISADFFSGFKTKSLKREESFGYLSSIEIPFIGDKQQVFFLEDRVVGFSGLWDGTEEKKREAMHKKLNMKPSEIYPLDNLRK